MRADRWKHIAVIPCAVFGTAVLVVVIATAQTYVGYSRKFGFVAVTRAIFGQFHQKEKHHAMQKVASEIETGR